MPLGSTGNIERWGGEGNGGDEKKRLLSLLLQFSESRGTKQVILPVWAQGHIFTLLRHSYCREKDVYS